MVKTIKSCKIELALSHFKSSKTKFNYSHFVQWEEQDETVRQSNNRDWLPVPDVWTFEATVFLKRTAQYFNFLKGKGNFELSGNTKLVYKPRLGNSRVPLPFFTEAWKFLSTNLHQYCFKFFDVKWFNRGLKRQVV